MFWYTHVISAEVHQHHQNIGVPDPDSACLCLYTLLTLRQYSKQGIELAKLKAVAAMSVVLLLLRWALLAPGKMLLHARSDMRKSSCATLTRVVSTTD